MPLTGRRRSARSDVFGQRQTINLLIYSELKRNSPSNTPMTTRLKRVGKWKRSYRVEIHRGLTSSTSLLSPSEQPTIIAVTRTHITRWSCNKLPHNNSKASLPSNEFFYSYLWFLLQFDHSPTEFPQFQQTLGVPKYPK